MASFASMPSVKSSVCLAAALMLSSAVMAQVHKCVAKDGKVTYEQSPCSGNSTVGGTVNLQGAGQARPASSSPAAAPNVYDASLKARIKELVADKEFGRAQALAVTEEHRKMVADAKKTSDAEDQEKAKARAARGAMDCLVARVWEQGRDGGYWVERRTCK